MLQLLPILDGSQPMPPLFCMPVLIKDNIQATPGMATTAGKCVPRQLPSLQAALRPQLVCLDGLPSYLCPHLWVPSAGSAALLDNFVPEDAHAVGKACSDCCSWLSRHAIVAPGPLCRWGCCAQLVPSCWARATVGSSCSTQIRLWAQPSASPGTPTVPTTPRRVRCECSCLDRAPSIPTAQHVCRFKWRPSSCSGFQSCSCGHRDRHW